MTVKELPIRFNATSRKRSERISNDRTRMNFSAAFGFRSFAAIPTEWVFSCQTFKRALAIRQ